jgi:hypothetical protein
MRITSNTFSNTMIPFRNDRYNSFSTQRTVDSITVPALDKTALRPHWKEIMLMNHLSQRFCCKLTYKRIPSNKIETNYVTAIPGIRRFNNQMIFVLPKIAFFCRFFYVFTAAYASILSTLLLSSGKDSLLALLKNRHGLLISIFYIYFRHGSTLHQLSEKNDIGCLSLLFIDRLNVSNDLHRNVLRLL